METKVCSKCKQELDKKFFGKIKKSTDGLNCYCKKCVNAVAKAWRETNPEKVKITRKAWNDRNHEKIKAMDKARYNANPGKVHARNKARYEANPENKKACAKAWYDANSEKVKARNKVLRDTKSDKLKAVNKAWRDANPELVKMYNQTRRAKKASLIATLTLTQWDNILIAFNNACAYCDEGDRSLHQEHFIALSKGGGYDVTNILPSCQSCNSSKGTKDFFVWYPKFKYYSKMREDKILKFLHY